MMYQNLNVSLYRCVIQRERQKGEWGQNIGDIKMIIFREIYRAKRIFLGIQKCCMVEKLLAKDKMFINIVQSKGITV